jgi:hypothetical protein
MLTLHILKLKKIYILTKNNLLTCKKNLRKMYVIFIIIIYLEISFKMLFYVLILISFDYLFIQN